MELSHFSEDQLKVLGIEFNSIISDININVWKMNQSRDVEHFAFLFVLDPSMIDMVLTDSNMPSDYDRNWIVRATDKLRVLWKGYGMWLYNERLVAASE